MNSPRVLRIAGLLVPFLFLAAGCIRGESVPPREAPVTGATQGGAVGVEPVIRPATPSTTRPTAGSVAKPRREIPASPTTTGQPPKKETAAPVPGQQLTTPLLDLASLERRLRDTKAIGLFTKLSLKNQVDDLLTQFRAFHQGQAGTVLSDLRERYNLLLLKVLSLLQGSDPMLARTIAGSREAIWGILADPIKFATL